MSIPRGTGPPGSRTAPGPLAGSARPARQDRATPHGRVVVEVEYERAGDQDRGQRVVQDAVKAARQQSGLHELIQSAMLGEIDNGLLTPLLENRIDGGILFLSGSPRQRDV